MAKGRRLSKQERECRRKESLKRLEDAAIALQSSAGWRRWVAVRRQNGLSRYSVNNTLLLSLQLAARGSAPSFVAGYRWWAQHGYQVRKGEHALWILGPVRRKVEEESSGEEVSRLVGFRDVSVFDRSQVEAGPDALALEPEERQPITGDSHAAMLEPLAAYAASIGVSVSYERIDGTAGGYFDPAKNRIAVESTAAANARVRTLLHEIGHALVKAERDEAEGPLRLSYAEEECIVECAGHVAASCAGLDTSGEAISYVAGWGEGEKLSIVRAAAELVDSIARRLEAVVDDLELETVASTSTVATVTG